MPTSCHAPSQVFFLKRFGFNEDVLHFREALSKVPLEAVDNIIRDSNNTTIVLL